MNIDSIDLSTWTSVPENNFKWNTDNDEVTATRTLCHRDNIGWQFSGTVGSSASSNLYGFIILLPEADSDIHDKEYTLTDGLSITHVFSVTGPGGQPGMGTLRASKANLRLTINKSEGYAVGTFSAEFEKTNLTANGSFDLIREMPTPKKISTVELKSSIMSTLSNRPRLPQKAKKYSIPENSFSWSENSKKYKSDEAIVLHDTGPDNRKSWIFAGAFGTFNTDEYRELVIYIYKDDPSELIVDETFTEKDHDLSAFHVYRGKEYVLQGEYNIKISFNPKLFEGAIEFTHHLERETVEITDGVVKLISAPDILRT